MFGQDIRKRRALILALRIAGYVAFVYLAAYFMMMEPRMPAYDPQTWDEAYDSWYRFGPIEQVPFSVIDLTTYLPTSCWANRLFWPADCVVHPVFDPYHRYMLERYGVRNNYP